MSRMFVLRYLSAKYDVTERLSIPVSFAKNVTLNLNFIQTYWQYETYVTRSDRTLNRSCLEQLESLGGLKLRWTVEDLVGWMYCRNVEYKSMRDDCRREALLVGWNSNRSTFMLTQRITINTVKKGIHYWGLRRSFYWWRKTDCIPTKMSSSKLVCIFWAQREIVYRRQGLVISTLKCI